MTPGSRRSSSRWLEQPGNGWRSTRTCDRLWGAALGVLQPADPSQRDDAEILALPDGDRAAGYGAETAAGAAVDGLHDYGWLSRLPQRGKPGQPDGGGYRAGAE